MKKLTWEQICEVYLQAVERERQQVALQMKIKAGQVTPSGKKIIRFGEIRNNSCRN